MISQTRFGMIHSGMTSAAKKVYAAVPISEAWSVTQIFVEMKRMGVCLEFPTVGGCLNTLISAGLVEEPNKGGFRREPIRAAAPEKLILPKKDDMKPTISKASEPAETTAVDKLGKLAERIMGAANLLKELSVEISDAAIDIQQELENKDGGLLKLKQLQSLLKSL